MGAPFFVFPEEEDYFCIIMGRIFIAAAIMLLSAMAQGKDFQTLRKGASFFGAVFFAFLK